MDAQTNAETLRVQNPATGKPLGEVTMTPLEVIPDMMQKARAAQAEWSQFSPRKRGKVLLKLRETLLVHMDELVDLLVAENGKPRIEALTNDLLPSVELTGFFAKRAPLLLKDREISIQNPILLHRRSYLNHWPIGVVAVISPWNFPFLLPYGEIVMALAAGNGVLFKPSEVTPLIAQKMVAICHKAGVPKDLIQLVQGGANRGEAVIQARPDKIFFTGSVSTGKKIMESASRTLTPVCLELGGKDPMIVLPDADLDYATSAALWGGFMNGGQVCASVERIFVHRKQSDAFRKLLAEKTATLRQGSDPDQIDVGPVTMDKQKKVYQHQINEARQAGANFYQGGQFSDDHRFLKPTLVSVDGMEDLSIYKEETFGPIITLSEYDSIDEAIQKANSSPYGLLASVITGDVRKGESVARRLEAGTVTINEAVYTAGLPETPWGGLKDSGFGRKHSDLGFMEFVHVRHIHRPRWNWLLFKSWWWYPYGPLQYRTFRSFLELYRKSLFIRLKTFPKFVWNFLMFILKEKRL